jgi:hypothetical protein
VSKASGAAAVALAALLLSGYWLVSADESPSSPDAGKVLLLKRSTPQFDSYTQDPSATLRSWMDAHFGRMLVYSPYFDSRTSWYSRGWVYIDSYAIYRDPSPGSPDIFHTHPDWILHDAAGRPLFIPWGCGGALGCPQAAADLSIPDFRRWWIDSAAQQLGRGSYAGVFIDDVNLDWRVSDSSGNFVNPVDRSTGSAMTEDQWRANFAAFLEQVRSELPGIEIVHNAIWYAGGGQRQANPAVQRQIGAADWVEIEHGVNDSGLTGGNGQWSLRALFDYIDSVHAAGKSVVIDGAGGQNPTPASLEYALACYLLVSTGRDALGDGGAATPDSWWPGFDVQLGAPVGPRTDWSGLMRRDFTGGMALVNEPSAKPVTVTLGGRYSRLDSSVVDAVTLAGGEGAVLLQSVRPRGDRPERQGAPPFPQNRVVDPLRP